MIKAPNVAEYQVRQTGNGINVTVIAEGALDHEALAASLERVLRGAGVPDPRVHVQEIATIPRLAQSGKTRRFIPGEPRTAIARRAWHRDRGHAGAPRGSGVNACLMAQVNWRRTPTSPSASTANL